MVELHDFFVAWVNGELPNTDEALARFADALDPRFAMVAPSGELALGAAVVASVRPGHGRADSDAPAGIEIRNVNGRSIADGLAVVTYEEWHFAGAAMSNARISSAVFVEAPDAPNGVAWLHLHETWLHPG